MHQYKGRLIIHTGSMFSGKTSGLINDIRRFSIANYDTVIFKPSIDNRYSENNVCSHDKIIEESILIDEEFEYDILKYAKDNDIHVVGIDEIQFFNSDNILDVIDRLLKLNMTIIVAGLDMDFNAYPFKAIKELMPRADIVHKHHAVCVDCGMDAWVSCKLSDNENRIEIGSSDTYVPLCRSCYRNRN